MRLFRRGPQPPELLRRRKQLAAVEAIEMAAANEVEAAESEEAPTVGGPEPTLVAADSPAEPTLAAADSPAEPTLAADSPGEPPPPEPVWAWGADWSPGEGRRGTP